MSKPLRKLIELTLGFVIAFLAITLFFDRQTNFEDFALGQETQSYFATAGQHAVHIDKLANDQIDELVQGWEKRGKKPVFLCLGNSQTHAINQKKDTDVNYVQIVFDTLQADSIDFLAHTLPNANLQEYYLSFSYWRQKFPIKYLVVPVFMDDLREDGIRKPSFEALFQNEFSISDTAAVAQKINTTIAAESGSQENADLAGLQGTIQEKSELYLSGKLDENWEAWKKRPEIRGRFFTSLYLFRNTLFGITPQSKRKLIPARYESNMAALRQILENADKENIKTCIYIPPLRNDIEPPYVLSEYESFKKAVEDLTAAYSNVTFLNLEDIVPGQYWGMKASTNINKEPEYDFMHFQYDGHVLLAKSLLPAFREMIEE